jgi:oligopeptide transport system substrate-binding protein
MSYQAGDLDTTLINGDQVDQVKDDPEFQAIGAGYLWYISPNQNGKSANPALKNVNIRLAMTMAMDREAITTDVLKDGSAPTYTAVPMDFATGPDGSDFSADQKAFSDVCSYNPEKAAELWKKGLAEEGIDKLKLTMLVDDDDAPKKVSQVLKEQWENTLEGFEVELKTVPKKKRLDDMENDNYEIALTRWGPDYADPMTYLGMWITDNLNNYGFWTNKEYDALIADCTTGKAATEPEVRWQKMYDAEKIVMDEAVIFPIYTQCNAEMLSSSVTGIEFHPVALNRVYKNTVKK